MRATGCLILAVLLSSSVFAKPKFSGVVEDFATALDLRIAEIDGVPSPTPEELKERAGLAKASATLDLYGGTTAGADLSIVGKALATAYKVNADADLGLAAGDLIEAFLGEGEYHQGLAHSARNLLDGDAAKAKVDAAIAKATALFPLAGAEPDWGKSAKIATKGILALVKTRGTTGKYLEKELASRSPYLTAVWPSKAFSAPPERCYANWYRTGTFGVGGDETVGDPRFLLTPGAANVFGVGQYPIAYNWRMLEQLSGYTPTDEWMGRDGQIMLLVLTKKVAAGTFTFTAESTKSGLLSVTSGTFLVPVSTIN